ncbi:hypothetical protein MBLNU13_g03954t1 [Cladosporium sp. NU13]
MLVCVPPEVPSDSHDIQPSPSSSASKPTDNGLRPKPRPHRKSVRAEDLWDRDEEELLLQRRAKELASSDLLAATGRKESLPDSIGSSEMPPNLHSFGGVVDGLIHSHLVEYRGQAYTRLEADPLNYAGGNIHFGSPEIQSNQLAYTRPEADALKHAEEQVPPRSAESQSHPDLKRSRDRYPDDISAREVAQPEPQKRRRNSAGPIAPSIMDNGLRHNTSLDALIDVLLKKLADEQGNNRAAKRELKRLKFHKGVADKRWGHIKRKKGKGRSAAMQREEDQAGDPCQSTISVDPSPPVKKAPDGISHLATFAKFGSLPEDVQDIIFGMLLKSPNPIITKNENEKSGTEFDSYLPAIQLEAEYHGLEVDRILNVSGKLKADEDV